MSILDFINYYSCLTKMADKTELRMNLAAIKRVDPYAKDIIDSSAHVAFYTFNQDETTEWEKTDVEGAFFVYSRNAEPYHSIFINNRLNTNSLVEPITAHIELQSQPPFLLYRNERNRIRGFWFYDRNECDRIGELVERIVKECHKTGSALPFTTAAISTTGIGSGSSKPIEMTPYSSNNVDIFIMLSKAQKDFNNSLSTPCGPTGGKNNVPAQMGPAQLLNMSNSSGVSVNKQIPHAAVPIAVPPKAVIDGTSQSVINFFAAVKPTCGSKEAPFLQRMMSAPVRITCDEIGKQQRVSPHNEKRSPPQQQQQQQAQQPQQSAFTKSSEIENGFGFKRINSPSQQLQTELDASPLAAFIGSGNNFSGGMANIIDGGKHVNKEPDSNKPLQELLKKQAPILSASLVNPTNTTTHKPALMPPTMFKSTHPSSTTNAKMTTSSSNSGGNVSIKKEPFITPTVNKSKPQKKNTVVQQQQQNQENSVVVEPLTQTQLLQAMSYLMRNDPEFVRKIHEAYLKSFTEKEN